MKVGTLNLQFGTGADGSPPNEENLRLTAGHLDELGVDVLALQEVDRRRVRSRFMDQTAYLSKRLGCEGYYARTTVGTGIGFVTRLPVLSVHEFELRKVQPALRTNVKGALLGIKLKPEQSRRVVYAVLGSWESPLVIGVAHFEANAAAVRTQLALALAGFGRIQRLLTGRQVDGASRFILAGDFNANPGLVADVAQDVPAALRKIGTNSTDSYGDPGAGNRSGLVNEPWWADSIEREWTSLAKHKTYPAIDPTQQIDFLLGSGVTAEHSRIERFAVSDHLGLFADIRTK